MEVGGMKFIVTLEKDENGWIVVECPALPGCVSQGRTTDEALKNIREAMQASLETRAAKGLPMAIDVAEIEIEVPAR
jgi:predicted RNase H-like HicB family nuclease